VTATTRASAAAVSGSVAAGVDATGGSAASVDGGEARIYDRSAVAAFLRDRLVLPLPSQGQQQIEIVRRFEDVAGRPCRLIRQSVDIDGTETWASATICRQPDGSWSMMRPSFARGIGESRNEICPRPGTIVETSLGGHLEFVRADGARCWYRTRDGAIESRYTPFLGGDSEWLESGGVRLRELFPMEIGREVSFSIEGATSTGYPSSWDQNYRVVGRERIRVPAGTFDTFVIRWQEAGRLANDWEATHTFWYAPEVGYFVKFEGATHTRKDVKDWEATRIVLPGPPSIAAQPAPEGSGTTGARADSRTASSKAPRR
jgi:hypothetical protein